MKEIVVLSGKGGVGKSSITASLGCLFSEEFKVVLSDTDVDAPNLDLVAGGMLEESIEVEASEKAIIDYEKCVSCMVCTKVCRFSSMIKAEQPVVVHYSCEGCGACSTVCPAEAIEIRKTPNGRINVFKGKSFSIVSGALHIGESSSGRLVDMVKMKARQKAEELHADLLLVDGPPGIGCPVIATLKGGGYIIAVTEPTPAALSDLKRLLEVAGSFKAPIGIVINKSDMHESMVKAIKDFAESRGIEILSEIPYDVSVAKAVAWPMPVVIAYPYAPASTALRELAERVKNEYITQ